MRTYANHHLEETDFGMVIADSALNRVGNQPFCIQTLSSFDVLPAFSCTKNFLSFLYASLRRLFVNHAEKTQEMQFSARMSVVSPPNMWYTNACGFCRGNHPYHAGVCQYDRKMDNP
ncbi:MAG: hypothetical protein ACI4WX_14930, partial [Aristaeellaceae bacterium]